MDELMISGRRYVSSARAAKEHGYHSDYIGQLIRGSKVKGQKVGRAWYVDAESLAVYLGKEIREAVAEQEAIEKSEEKREVAAKAELSPEPAAASQGEVVAEPEEVPVAITEEIIEEKFEERRVPISKVGERQPLRKPETIIEVPRKMSGLKYISDDEPLLPEIHKNKMLSREPDAEPVLIEDEPVHIKIEERVPQPAFLRQGIALAALGVMVLVVVAAASSLFVYTVSVGSTQTAGVQFVLPQ